MLTGDAKKLYICAEFNRQRQYFWMDLEAVPSFEWLYAELRRTADIFPIKVTCTHFILATGAASAPQGTWGMCGNILSLPDAACNGGEQ